MKAQAIIYLLAIILFARPGAAQNIQTNFFPLLVCSNRIYTNATIDAVTPTTATISWGSSGERIPFSNLPPELQDRYYNPQELEKMLAKQSVDNAAKNARGPAQKIRVTRFLSGDNVQIETTNGDLFWAVVHTLPKEIKDFLIEYQQTKARIDGAKSQLQADLERANRGYGSYMTGGGKMAVWNNANVNDARADQAAAKARADNETMLLNKLVPCLNELQQRFSSGNTVIIAYPTAFFVNKTTRFWECQTEDDIQKEKEIERQKQQEIEEQQQRERNIALQKQEESDRQARKQAAIDNLLAQKEAAIRNLVSGEQVFFSNTKWKPVRLSKYVHNPIGININGLIINKSTYTITSVSFEYIVYDDDNDNKLSTDTVPFPRQVLPQTFHNLSDDTVTIPCHVLPQTSAEFVMENMELRVSIPLSIMKHVAHKIVKVTVKE
jgi:hypothetical protein